MTSGKRLILQNSFWLLLEKVILMGGGLVLSIAFARVLGPETFGQYNYLLSFAALFTPLFALGMTNVLLREFSRSPETIPSILKTCFNARFYAGAGLTLVAGLGLFVVFGHSWKFQLLSLLLLANISNAFEVFERWFQHKSMNRQTVQFRIGNFSLFAVAKIYVVLQHQSLYGLVLLVALELLAKNIGYRLLYQRYRDSRENGRFERAVFDDIFAQTRFLIFSALASVVYLKMDVLMLEAMVGAEEVGIYSVAAKISEVWYVLPQVAITAMFPKLLEIAKDSQQRYLAIMQRGFDWLFISALMLALVIYAISPWLIGLLFGLAYSESVAILQLHIFASLFIYMRVLLSQWLVSEKFAEYSLASQLSGALSNVLLNLWLIPLYGAWGAAVATVTSYSITTYFCLFFHVRTRPIANMMTKAMLFPLRLRSVFGRLP